jgi:alanyl aminopeptidase
MTLRVPKGDLALFNTPQISEIVEPGGMKAVKFKEPNHCPVIWWLSLLVPSISWTPANSDRLRCAWWSRKARATVQGTRPEAIPQLLKLLEKYFGTPFPNEKLDSAVMPISNFAMENAGLITHGQTLLLPSLLNTASIASARWRSPPLMKWLISGSATT